MLEVEPLYKVKVDCIICENSFETSRMRPSFKKGVSTDSDFCIHYKDPEMNPDYYVVRVCPRCGYASTENFSTSITERQIQLFKEKVTDHWTWRDYSGQRTWEEALQTYQLALISAQIKQESDRIIASLLHHIAWFYRYKNKESEERRFLKHALDAYTKVYEYEGIDVNNARLMYLIGELHRRLENYHEAVQWFSRVVNDKKIVDAAMIAACREQWAVVSEQLRTSRSPDQTQENP